MTDAQAIQLFSQPCHYCGVAPSQCSGHDKMNGQFKYNGIDRVNNAEGYTSANTVAACGDCNRAKFNKDSDSFREWIRRVYQHQNG